MSDNSKPLTVVMLGATGAVGSEVVRALSAEPALERLTLLGRRELPGLSQENIRQHRIDLLKPDSYQALVSGHQCAICTLGIGEPSKASKEDFLRIDRQAVLDFAIVCKQSGVEHFQLLSSVGANARSRSFYLRSKGELNEALQALQFKRLSLFQPSMIITPHNRYGVSQAITLAIWPTLSKVMFGPMNKLRGIGVVDLGTAMAINSLSRAEGVEALHWQEITKLISQKT